MNEKVENKLTDIPETMLITLWAKAAESKLEDALLHDDKAVEIIQKIDYDFSKFKKAKFSQAGCCIRANLIDKEVEAYLALRPDAVVIQLGAGIDARYERLNRPPGITHWYDLDLPEAIELRKKLIQGSERNSFIANSMFNYEWIERVKSHNKPVLIILEGVLMYFKPDEVKALFEELCNQFDDATVIFDMLAFALVGRSKQHDSLRKVGGEVEFQWSLLNTKEMETWNPKIQVEKEYYMSEYEHGRYPFIFRMLYKIPYFFRRFNQRVVMLRIFGAT